MRSLVEIEGLVVVPHVEVGLGAVVAVADVVNGDLVPVDVRVSQHRHVRLPVAVIRGLEREPPREHEREAAGGQAQLRASGL